MNKDQTKGKAKQTKGNLKETHSRATGDTTKRNDGKFDKAEGKDPAGYGKVKS